VVAAMEQPVGVVPRDDVINYGILPISLLCPSLGESPTCLLALHKALLAKATPNADGQRELGWAQWIG
jgi:hypothetical protein